MPELKNSIAEGDLVADNYRILGVAGSGGMGVVYRARDLRLERVVALKFLPSELNASQRDKERFMREARTASSLDHPNIGVIHGVEETADERTFIVMAFYEGTSLAQRIRNGPLPAHQAIDIASQVARGLAEAHSRGIVHRDIKPSNVMVTGSGLVKIVDFGLAHAANAQSTTQSGISGTVAYMAPEQAMGNRVDQRCDIWALGVVMVEMLTADSPFRSDSSHSILAAILNSAPQNIDRVHPALQPILYRALAKEPDRRYQSCGELLSDLESAGRKIPANAVANTPSHELPTVRFDAVTRRARQDASRSVLSPAAPSPRRFMVPLLSVVGLLAVLVLVVLLVPAFRHRAAALVGGAPEQEHVAVLPFDNIGSNPENAALADGLMDSLAGRLSNLDVGNQSLWVVPTSMVRRHKVTDPSDALKQLGANLVVKGSIERDGTDIHLNVNLIDTKSMRQIGSADVDDRAGDLSTLEDETVARLAHLMNISVTPDMLRNTGGRVNPAAYEDYLTALGYMQRYDKPGNLDSAITALQRSTQTDPGFALGYVAAGEAYRLKYRVDQNLHWLDEAQANCQKAAELDNSVPAIYVTLAQIHDALSKHDLALQEFHHALQLDPQNSTALDGLARSYEKSARIPDAEKTFREAAAIHPDAWFGYNELGNFYERQGKYPQSIAAYQKALAITPDNAELYSNLAAAYIDQGGVQSLKSGEEALKKSIALNPSYPAYANLGMLYMQEKRYTDAAAATEGALKMNSNNYLVWNNLMLDYEGAGDQIKAETARQRAEQAAENWVATKPEDAVAQSILATLYAQDRQNAKAQSKIETSLALAPADPSVLANVGEAYELLRQREQALKYVEKAIAKGYALDDLTSDPDLQALVADPRFKKNLK
ncbi:MAG TPA: protein kinase [Silvibacterium sp.]|nr:protein kinase [Silvibacterium sp.]